MKINLTYTVNKKLIQDVNGKVLLHFEFNKNIINLEYDLMELSHYDKRRLFNFYHLKKVKLK